MGIGEDELGAVGPDALEPLAAGVAGHHQRHTRTPSKRAEHRVGDPGVARGRVEQPSPAIEPPFSARPQRDQNPTHGPILDRPAGVDRLELGQQSARPPEAPAPAVQIHQRRRCPTVFEQTRAPYVSVSMDIRSYPLNAGPDALQACS